MKNLLADFATEIIRCSDDTCAWCIAEKFFRSLGFDTVNYGLLDRDKGTFLGFYTTMDPEWLQFYADNNYDHHDPLITHCQRHDHAVHYSFDGPSQLEITGSKQETKVLADCYDAGVRSSFLIPFNNGRLPTSGGINLAGTMSAAECQKLVETHRSEILVASALLNSYLASIPPAAQRGGSWFNLHNDDEGITQREREVLKWLSQGLRNDRVAECMNVTPATINFHMGSIKKKLGARTREQALVIAMRKGLVSV